MGIFLSFFLFLYSYCRTYYIYCADLIDLVWFYLEKLKLCWTRRVRKQHPEELSGVNGGPVTVRCYKLTNPQRDRVSSKTHFIAAAATCTLGDRCSFSPQLKSRADAAVANGSVFICSSAGGAASCSVRCVCGRKHQPATYISAFVYSRFAGSVSGSFFPSIFTSTNGVTGRLVFICLSCIFSKITQKVIDFNKIFWKCWEQDKEQMITFWRCSMNSWSSKDQSPGLWCFDPL